MKLSPGSEREAAMEAGLRRAISVPLRLAQHVDAVWETLIEMAAVGNINCKSDLQVLNKKSPPLHFQFVLLLPFDGF
jgi:glutamate formiminotransferase/formiminotetrahydrofolate cyclodeaminase